MLIKTFQNCVTADFPRRGFAAFILLVLLGFSAAPARSQTLVTNILYQDEFSGSGPLDGWLPDTVDQGTNAWFTDDSWYIDGTEAVEYSGLGSAFLPFTPLPGRVYMLSATVADYDNASGVALGFTATASGVAHFATDINSVGWLLATPEGASGFNQCYIGPNELGEVTETGFGGPDAFSPTNYTIVFDTRPSNPTNWTFTFLAGSQVMRPTQAFGTPGGQLSGPVINYVGFGNDNANDYCVVQNFTLSEVTVAGQAPTIVTPPQPPPAGTNFPGDYVTLSVGAAGYPGPYYQWRFDSNIISGATNSSLVLSNLTFANAGLYQVVVSNYAGSVTSAPVPVYVVNPVTNVVYADAFSTGIGGALAGRTPDTAGSPTAWVASPTWLIENMNGGNYAVAGGDPDSPAAFLPFTPAPGQVYVLTATLDYQAGGPGWIALGYSSADAVEDPFYAEGGVGWVLARDDGDIDPNQGFEGPSTSGSLDFNEYSSGPATYTTILDTRPLQPSKWTFLFEVNGEPVTLPTVFGGNGPTISYVGVGVYQDGTGTVQNFSLTELSEPVKPYFTQPPQGGAYYVGETVTLSATVGGAAPLTYQWERNSIVIPGATNLSLTLSNLVSANAGSYQLKAINQLGSTVSAAAVLAVSNAPTAVDLSSNLVLHLKFDRDYLDYSGRGNNATSVGASIVPGQIGSGALLYGGNGSVSDLGYATLGTPSDLLFGDSASFSVAFWIQYTNVPDNEVNGSYPPYAFPDCDLPVIGNALNSTYQTGWVFAQGGEGCENNPGGFVWTLTDTSGHQVVVAGPAHSQDDGNWHNLVVTIDRNLGYGTTYLDGVEVNSTSVSSIGNIDTGNVITIGQDPTDAYSSAGAANLDDLSIWRRALSPYEVRTLYAAGATNYVGVASQPLPVTAATSGGQVTVTWSAGILQSAPALTGPWTTVPNAVKPSYTNTASGDMLYFRAIQ